MVKKFSTMALAALIALPAVASAGGGDLSAQIDKLSQELAKLKQEMSQMQETTSDAAEDLEERAEKWDLASRIQISGDFRVRADYVTANTQSAYTALNVAKGVNWFNDPATLSPTTTINGTAFSISDNTHTVSGTPASTAGTLNLLAGFGLTYAQAAGQLGNMIYGDPTAIAYTNGGPGGTVDTATVGATTPLSTSLRTQNLVAFMKTFTPAQRVALFSAMGYSADATTDYDNDTIWTNRLRLNLRAKATEDLEFKGRLAMYKAWGMQNNPVDYTYNAGNGGGTFMLNSLGFDGSSTRQPVDNILRVDRAFLNWNNIGGQPIWFSIGRRPTTDGPPAQLRLGADKKMATPVNYMDYPFDGLSVGYAYENLFGIQDFPGRVRFCYGRGFESGPTENGDGLKDVDFAGISWDVYKKGNRFFNFQSFAAYDMFNVPDNVTFVNPLEFVDWDNDSTLYDPLDTSKNNILDRANLGNIYHTATVYMSKYQDLNYFVSAGWSRTDASGVDEMGTSLLGSWWDDPVDKDGYSFYGGVRYDFPEQPFKVGLEVNYGTKNWIAFTPGNDDLYASKLATRGTVVEAYTIWDVPAGDKISKFGKAFVRAGYQHYEYDYTGSGFWLGEPVKIDDLANDPLNAQFYVPVDSMDQVYVSLEAWF